jgi:hypothetical protein
MIIDFLVSLIFLLSWKLCIRFYELRHTATQVDRRETCA